MEKINRYLCQEGAFHRKCFIFEVKKRLYLYFYLCLCNFPRHQYQVFVNKKSQHYGNKVIFALNYNYQYFYLSANLKISGYVGATQLLLQEDLISLWTQTLISNELKPQVFPTSMALWSPVIHSLNVFLIEYAAFLWPSWISDAISVFLFKQCL